MSNAAYLRRFFWHAEDLATACQLSLFEFDELVKNELVPQPAYVVAHGQLTSAVFGELGATQAAQGRYFHPGLQAFVARAKEHAERVTPIVGRLAQRSDFIDGFTNALQVLDRTLYRLPDCFDDAGAENETGLHQRATVAWGHFVKGIFGLCVADPSSEANIARKEVLQEALTSWQTRNKPHDAEQRQQLLAWIDEYAQLAMPFAPDEYPRSSRKRLVEDFRAQLIGQARKV